MLKLNLEVTATNNEELLKALDEIKMQVELGAISFTIIANDNYNYCGEISEE